MVVGDRARGPEPGGGVPKLLSPLDTDPHTVVLPAAWRDLFKKSGRPMAGELGRHGLSVAGAHVVVLGRGTTVGRSIGLLLTRREHNATVTLTHTGTRDLAVHLRTADVVVAAAGVPGIVRAEDLKPGAVVLDVGVSRRVDPETGRTRLVGDVDPAVAEVAGWLSPNPGGVGPMTRAMLLANVVEAAEARLR